MSPQSQVLVPSPPLPLPKSVTKKTSPPKPNPIIDLTTLPPEEHVVEFWLSHPPPQVAKPKPKSVITRCLPEFTVNSVKKKQRNKKTRQSIIHL
jgi:hypothetical protein